MNNIPDQKVFKFLYNKRKDTQNFRKEIHNDIIPYMADFISQIRSLTKDIAIISGAIAAFTIPTLNTEVIKTKILAQIAILLLFSTIIYAVYHLTEILPNELNGLSKQMKFYMGLIDAEMEGIDKSIEKNDLNNYLKSRKDIVKELTKSNKVIEKPDRSLDYLRLLLFAALILIFLSLFDYSYFINLI